MLESSILLTQNPAPTKLLTVLRLHFEVSMWEG